MPFQPVPASVSRTPANQTSLNSASLLMAGLGAIASVPCALTPTTTGRVLVTFTGNLVFDLGGRTSATQISYGTGAAPANRAAVTGTQTGGSQAMVSLANQLTVPFSIHTLITGLTPGTAYWFDLAGSDSAGTVQYTNLSFSAIEL